VGQGDRGRVGGQCGGRGEAWRGRRRCRCRRVCRAGGREGPCLVGLTPLRGANWCSAADGEAVDGDGGSAEGGLD